ncbi:gamma-glutamyl-gamma-aminobutyrate hydrolase family protein [Streptomyces longisporoflavus]|uniref:Gamma-glutamyl-gamma-aminobutyrate hydrolase family protein n=1 Tax=Streptomyces longisporoflavus TaxID=28044 RepID=A0ABW7QK79_9ACTN
MPRPLIALPQRYAASTSALRYEAVVTARALAEAVFRAGGEPFMMLPSPPDEAAARLARCDGLLLPGGGDLAPWRYVEGGAGSGEQVRQVRQVQQAQQVQQVQVHGSVYDVDDAQDAFDLALARRALACGLPLLAVCRGLQVVNVALGGTLRQDMGGAGPGSGAESGPGPEPGSGAHRHRVHSVRVASGSEVARAMGGAESVSVSCFHHQCVEVVGRGLVPAAWAADGTVEALELPGGEGWFAAIQWHPEDTAASDAAQRGLFGALVQAASSSPTPPLPENPLGAGAL